VTLGAALPVLLAANPTRRFAGVCVAFVGLTAGVGAARYAGFDVALVHDSMSWTSRMIAVPALGPAFVALLWGRKIIKPYWYGLSLLLGGIGWALPPDYALVPGVVAMLLILGVAARTYARAPKVALAAGLGVLAVSLAGLLIGTRGQWAGLLRIDLFHYALAVGHAALGYALWGLAREPVAAEAQPAL